MLCNEWQVNPTNPSLSNILDFLSDLFDSGLSYSALNTARSALSTLIMIQGRTAGSHPTIIRFIKAVYNLRPSLPRYSNTWDVSVVLGYLKGLSPLEGLSFKDLSLKLVMLMAVITAQRGQTLHRLDMDNMTKSDSAYTFYFTLPLKQTKPGIPLQPLVHDADLCIYQVITAYLQRTRDLRTAHSQLLISFQKPHLPIGRDTLARWISTVIARSGINTTFYKPHTTRSASVSVASQANLPLTQILKMAGWSSVGTFCKFYHKPVVATTEFADCVLDQVQVSGCTS